MSGPGAAAVRALRRPTRRRPPPLLSLLVLALAGTACLHGRPAASAPGGVEEGLASFYADAFQGRPTASGQPYDPAALTCAHRTAPFGARLRVTELETGRSVVVTVNDRGPHRAGRIVDLSRAAAERLGMTRRGLVRVRVERAAGPGA